MIYYYDIEVFKNFFSALFISEDFQDEYIFLKYGNRDDIAAMIAFVTLQKDLTLVGYNNSKYDDIIMKGLIQKPEITNKQIYTVSKAIVGANRIRDLPQGLKDLVYAPTPWRSADMMALLEINTNRPGLKHCAIHLEHDRLQDLPKAFDSNISPNEVDTIIKYNRNDVRITGKLWNHPEIKKALEMRDGLGELYPGEDFIAANDSKIANIILEREYGVPEQRGTRREMIRGKDLIPSTLEFKTPTLQAVQKVIEDLILVEHQTENEGIVHLTYPKRKQFEHVFEFNGTTYKMGKGGLHSDDQPRLLKTDDRFIYRDCDVGSYYPSMVVEYGIVPQHLDRARFLTVYQDIIKRRLDAKHSGNKVIADGLKIAINGVFGKFNFQYFWLYDPLCLYKVTLYGQLLLLMLIEMLAEQGIQCVSANTDGIVCKIPRDKEDIYFKTCIAWQEKTGMSLEYTDYNFLAQLNVNSYMSHAVREGIHTEDMSVSWKDKDAVKTRKDFLDNKYLTKQSFVKGYQAPVIALALQEYFLNGTLPETYITNHENIHDFFYTQKTAGKFYMAYVMPDGSETALQKTNRFYVSEDGGVLVKRDKTNYALENFKAKSRVTRETAIWKGERVTVLNDITEKRPEPKYQFYIDKTYEIIHKIVPPGRSQKTVFDLI